MSDFFKQFKARFRSSPNVVATPTLPQRTTPAIATQGHTNDSNLLAFLDGQDLMRKVERFVDANPDITRETLLSVRECLAPCGAASLPFNIVPYGATFAQKIPLSQAVAPQAYARSQPSNVASFGATPVAVKSAPAGATPAYPRQTTWSYPMTAQAPAQTPAPIVANNAPAVGGYDAMPTAYPLQSLWGRSAGPQTPAQATAPAITNTAPVIRAYGTRVVTNSHNNPKAAPAPAPIITTNAPAVAAYGTTPAAYPQQAHWSHPMAQQVAAHYHSGNKQHAPSDYFSLPVFSPMTDSGTPALVHDLTPPSTRDTPLPMTPTDVRLSIGQVASKPAKRWMPAQTPVHRDRSISAGASDCDADMADVRAMDVAPLTVGGQKRKAERDEEEDGGVSKPKKPRREERTTRAEAVAGPSQRTSLQETVEALVWNSVKVQSGDRGESVVAVNIVPEVLTTSQPGPSALRKMGLTSGMKPTGEGRGWARFRGKAVVLDDDEVVIVGGEVQTVETEKGIRKACPARLCRNNYQRTYDVWRHVVDTHLDMSMRCIRCGTIIRGNRNDVLLRHQRSHTCMREGLKRMMVELLASRARWEPCARNAEGGQDGSQM
ncbi:hypothetical protein BV25DRAFT_1575508 [Artomyces pyxidatus]|uniref:Uncharacterized protein n=1 Tax=Artomyces pyxidatus TaxID=48021 RepID=A0ACB8SIP4_9AGAM|nr:hypothetical protein BV25DRAFT_1575508 [Artomyces pyxidatus]